MCWEEGVLGGATKPAFGRRCRSASVRSLLGALGGGRQILQCRMMRIVRSERPDEEIRFEQVHGDSVPGADRRRD